MKRYLFMSYAILGASIAGITVMASPLENTQRSHGTINAEYAMPHHASLNISMDPAHVARASIHYGHRGLFGQKTIDYWFDHGHASSRFMAPGETETRAQVISTSHAPGMAIETSSIRVNPTDRHVSVAGHQGRIYRISARIDGKMQTWDAVLASGENMPRLNGALNRLLGELGPIQPSGQIAATMLAENLHPELRGLAPLKIGKSIELKALANSPSTRLDSPATSA